MAKITMSLEDDLLKQVRKIAREKDTTLTALVRNHLRRLAAREVQKTEAVIERLQTSFNCSGVIVGPRTWSREDLHVR